MNFGFTDDQEALRALAVKVLEDHCPLGHPLPAADEGLWRALVSAGLVGAPFDPPAGAGQGLTGLCLLAEELGRRAAAVPLWGNGVTGLVLSAVAPSLAGRWLPALAEGQLVAALALEEAAGYDPRRPVTTAQPIAGGGWRLDGTKVAVPYATTAGLIAVGASGPDGPVLALVDPAQAGVRAEAAESTDDEPSGMLRLDGAEVDGPLVLGGGALDLAVDLATAVLCATAAGVVEGGLRITADYIAGRQQFGRPIASFQGPAMRIADAYIDSQAVWTSAWSAIWRMDAGRSHADALAIAKFWAADGGQRAVHAFQHLHGGMGVDTSYPIHRYFYMAKALEVRLGGATAQLERLGASLAGAAMEGV